MFIVTLRYKDGREVEYGPYPTYDQAHEAKKSIRRWIRATGYRYARIRDTRIVALGEVVAA